MAALTLLTEMWLAFTDYLDAKEDRVGFVQSVLKKAARDRQKSLRLVAVALSFRLLDKFAQEKNSSAPALYKALIFSLIENPGDLLLREHYFGNFSALFESQPSIPVSLLLDPLLKQIAISENVTYFYKTADFDFFQALAALPKLTPANGLSLADLLCKLYLRDPVLASAASQPLLRLFARFLTDDAMQEFLVKFARLCLSSLEGLERNAEELQRKWQQTLQEQELARQGTKKLAIQPEFEHKHGKPTKRMTKEDIAKQAKDQD